MHRRSTPLLESIIGGWSDNRGYACRIIFDSESGSGVESGSTAERFP